MQTVAIQRCVEFEATTSIAIGAAVLTTRKPIPNIFLE